VDRVTFPASSSQSEYAKKINLPLDACFPQDRAELRAQSRDLSTENDCNVSQLLICHEREPTLRRRNPKQSAKSDADTLRASGSVTITASGRSSIVRSPRKGAKVSV
jgi:hypothetical protein